MATKYNFEVFSIKLCIIHLFFLIYFVYNISLSIFFPPDLPLYLFYPLLNLWKLFSLIVIVFVCAFVDTSTFLNITCSDHSKSYKGKLLIVLYKRGLVHYHVGQHRAGEKAESSISGVGSLLQATRRDSGTGLSIGNRKSTLLF